jgi:hypothetical protein
MPHLGPYLRLSSPYLRLYLPISTLVSAPIWAPLSRPPSRPLSSLEVAPSHPPPTPSPPQAGYSYFGSEPLYNGLTGQLMQAEIFMGVVYYQRLRHMVSDKSQARSTGAVMAITRQPVKGRKKHGGIRLGEMERDALLSHGVAFCLHDRLMNCSDAHLAYVCGKCGGLLSVYSHRAEVGGWVPLPEPCFPPLLPLSVCPRSVRMPQCSRTTHASPHQHVYCSCPFCHGCCRRGWKGLAGYGAPPPKPAARAKPPHTCARCTCRTSSGTSRTSWPRWGSS